MTNFISYGRQFIDEEDIKAVTDVLTSDFLTQGPKIEEFERAVCDYTGAKYCIAVSNGTAALHLAVLALEIEKGSEGITTPITFAASSNCLLYCGLKPVFADINSKTYNIDLKEIKRRSNKSTKVVVAVDFAGQPASLEEIYPWAKEKGIYVIEDAAHSLGSKFSDGSMVGACKYSDLATFSFHPVKTITTGEGGAITTNNQMLYERLKLLRSHGITKEKAKLNKNDGPWYYEMQTLGFNYRLTDIQAALGLSQLAKLDGFAKRRMEIVRMYNNAFFENPMIEIPFERANVSSVFHLYAIKVNFKKLNKTRVKVVEELISQNIGTQVHYIPVHLQPYYRQNFGYKEGDYPIAEDYYGKCLSLPLYPAMTDEEVNYVIDQVNKVTA